MRLFPLPIFALAIAVPWGAVAAARAATISSVDEVTSIEVKNASFSRGTGSSVADWRAMGGQFGVYEPKSIGSTLTYPNGVPGPPNVAYSWGGTIRQTTAAAYDPALLYRLGVQVGNRSSVAFGGFEIRLLVGSRAVAELTAANTDTAVYRAGTWTPVTIDSSDAPLVIDATWTGAPISIELSAQGDPELFSEQTNFDLVTLTSEPNPAYVPDPVPEPLGFAGVVGVAGVVLRRRRRV